MTPIWEYKKITFSFKDRDIEPEILNKLGREGWELVSVVEKPGYSENYKTYYFKRPY